MNTSHASSQGFCCLQEVVGCQGHAGLGLCSDFVPSLRRTGRVVPGLTPQLSCTAPAAPSMPALLSQNRPKAGHFSPVRVPAHHLFMTRLLCAPRLLWSQ